MGRLRCPGYHLLARLLEGHLQRRHMYVGLALRVAWLDNTGTIIVLATGRSRPNSFNSKTVNNNAATNSLASPISQQTGTDAVKSIKLTAVTQAQRLALHYVLRFIL